MSRVTAASSITLISALLITFTVAFGGGAVAGVESVSDQPAATLLLPYFEVDLKKPRAATTLMSINNTSATAILTHVVIWSDLSVPSLEFNVYLTGYGMYQLNLQDLLTKGVMPQTASAGQDPHDTISPKGILSQDINFASCNGQLPYGPLPALQLAGLQASLTGQPSVNFANLCGSLDHGDRIARGYITVDTVNNCTQRFPGDIGYFGAGGTGDVTNQNTLWGDSFYINQSNHRAFAEPLVHILASATDPLTSVSGNYTFYGRYDNFTAVDNRQPLTTSFAARFINPKSEQGKQFFAGGTSMIVWRDSKVRQLPFTCPAVSGVRPSWEPLGQDGILVFDEQEHPQLPVTCPIKPCPPNPTVVPFPAGTQLAAIGGTALPTSFDAGWILLDLNTTVAAAGAVPPIDPAAAQAWVMSVFDQKAGGDGYRLGERATQLDSATAASHYVP